jgi:hypothetical protein
MTGYLTLHSCSGVMLVSCWTSCPFFSWFASMYLFRGVELDLSLWDLHNSSKSCHQG